MVSFALLLLYLPSQIWMLVWSHSRSGHVVDENDLSPLGRESAIDGRPACSTHYIDLAIPAPFLGAFAN